MSKTSMEKRKSLIETSPNAFCLSTFVSSDFPDYESYNRFMNLYEEERKRQGTNPSNAMTYNLMRKALVPRKSEREQVLELLMYSDAALELLLRSYKPLFYSFFSVNDYDVTIVDTILRNMQKLAPSGSRYSVRQFRQAIHYTINPELMLNPRREGNFRWESGFRQFLLLRSLDELEIMFNNDFVGAEHFFYSSAQAAQFKSALSIAPKGCNGNWSGSQIKYALEIALKVGHETQNKVAADLFSRSAEEKYFILVNGTSELRYSYLPDSCWCEIRKYYKQSTLESWTLAAEEAFNSFYYNVRKNRSVESTVNHKECTTTFTKVDMPVDLYKEKEKAMQPVSNTEGFDLYPGSYPSNDCEILRKFLLLPDKQIMQIIQAENFLSWANFRGILNTQVKEALKDKPKTAKQIREAIEKHFRKFGWTDFPTLVDLVAAGRLRAMTLR